LRFQEVMEKMERLRRSVTPEEVSETRRVLAEQKRKPKKPQAALDESKVLG